MTTEAVKAKKISAAQKALEKAQEQHGKALDRHLAAANEAGRLQAVCEERMTAIAKAQAHLDWVNQMPTEDGPVTEQVDDGADNLQHNDGSYTS